MPYHVVDPSELDPMPDRPSDARSISDAVGLQNLGLRRYDIAPGEDMPVSGLHYHDEQEEVFYVVSGTLHVETPDQEYVVPADHFFVAEPGSPQRAFVHADADGNALVVAMGAPAGFDAHRYEP